MSEGHFQFAIEKLLRRIMFVIGFGRIKTVNDTGNIQLVQVKLGEMEVRDKTARMAEYGFTSNPPIDTDAVMVFVGGDRSNGIVIATGHQSYRMKKLASGEVAIHDDLGQSVHLTRNGIVVKGAGLPMLITDTPMVTVDAPTIHATGDVNLDGNLTVKGAATVTGQITGMGGLAIAGGGGGAAAQITGTLHASGDIVAGGVSLEQHKHPDADGGFTGAPS